MEIRVEECLGTMQENDLNITCGPTRVGICPRKGFSFYFFELFLLTQHSIIMN